MIQILKKAVNSIINSKTLADIENKAIEKYESLLAAEIKETPVDNKPTGGKQTTVETV